nr:MAG TPA: hypothetical protein [Crassvirales sp.]DAR56548.1 MAG TPA: hypothetical protein [Crassvirales sp.]
MLLTRDTRPRTKSDMSIISLVSKTMYVWIWHKKLYLFR